MAKDYNTFSDVSTGDVYTAAAHNLILENVENYRVPPMCKVRRDATQAIANNTQRLVYWDTEDVDTDSMFTASSLEITINTAGVYLVTACIGFAVNFTSTRGVQIVVNPTISGSTTSANVTAGTRIAMTMTDCSPATQSVVTATTAYNFAASDTIGVIAYQNSGGNLNIPSTATEQVSCSVVWLGQAS